jgi:hypothetical protein
MIPYASEATMRCCLTLSQALSLAVPVKRVQLQANHVSCPECVVGKSTRGIAESAREGRIVPAGS